MDSHGQVHLVHTRPQLASQKLKSFILGALAEGSYTRTS
jgi:hypothetical protein